MQEKVKSLSNELLKSQSQREILDLKIEQTEQNLTKFKERNAILESRKKVKNTVVFSNVFLDW